MLSIPIVVVFLLFGFIKLLSVSVQANRKILFIGLYIGLGTMLYLFSVEAVRMYVMTFYALFYAIGVILRNDDKG